MNLEIGKGVSLVSVPNVVSYTPEEAKKALNEANLQYEEVPQSSSDADKGKALAQDPAPQTQVAPGTTVKVTVGTGLETVQVPDGLVGKSLDEATAMLTAAKLQVVSQEADGTEPRESGHCDGPGRRRPGAGGHPGHPDGVQQQPDGDAEPGEQHARTRRSAALQDQGWQGDADSLRQSTTPVTNPGLVGAIISQNAGRRHRWCPRPEPRCGCRSASPSQITIPDVVGKTEAEARAAMAGIPNVTFATVGGTPPGQAGTVQGQTAGGQVGRRNAGDGQRLRPRGRHRPARRRRPHRRRRAAAGGGHSGPAAGG